MSTSIQARCHAIYDARTKLPIFGHIFKCRWKDFWDSLVEYSNALIWSTMPFWLGAVILFYQQQNGNKAFIDTLTGTFRNGELLVFTIGAVTPIIYLALFEDPKGTFPHRLSVGTLAMFLIVVCASLFALQKGQVATKGSLVYYSSLIFAAVAISLRYLSILYNKTRFPSTTENDLIQSSTTFLDEFTAATNETISSHNVAPVTAAQTAHDAFSEKFKEATAEHVSTGTKAGD